MEIAEICRMVARTLMSEIGPWGDRCALFGGLVPGLLVPEPPEHLAAHIGTTDVDVALRVAALSDDREMYRTLKQNLTKIGLKQSNDPSFKWHRHVEEVGVEVELFVPVEEAAQAGRMQRKPIEQSGSGLTALGIYGLELIERDVVVIPDEGPLLDGLGVKKVDLRVCGPAMLLGLKAWALTERNKTKDGYDTVWLLKALGPDTLADRYRAADLHNTEFGRQALQRMADSFASAQHIGAVGWVRESGFEGAEAAREALEAFGFVQEFVKLARG
jgi:hypothetical protein